MPSQCGTVTGTISSAQGEPPPANDGSRGPAPAPGPWTPLGTAPEWHGPTRVAWRPTPGSPSLLTSSASRVSRGAGDVPGGAGGRGACDLVRARPGAPWSRHPTLCPRRHGTWASPQRPATSGVFSRAQWLRVVLRAEASPQVLSRFCKNDGNFRRESSGPTANTAAPRPRPRPSGEPRRASLPGWGEAPQTPLGRRQERRGQSSTRPRGERAGTPAPQW